MKRHVDTIIIHCSATPEGSIGICYEGGLDIKGKPKDTRTAEQKKALKWLIETLKKEFPIKEIAGHGDFSPNLNGNGKIEPEECIKECPCFDVKNEGY